MAPNKPQGHEEPGWVDEDWVPPTLAPISPEEAARFAAIEALAERDKPEIDRLRRLAAKRRRTRRHPPTPPAA